MKQRISWVQDVDSSKVNVFEFVQIMGHRRPGKYLLGRAKSNNSPDAVGVYFDENSLSPSRPKQSSVVIYLDTARC